MDWHDMMGIKGLLILGSLCISMPALGVALLAVLLALAPRKHTRQLRHKLAGVVVWQWVKGSKISAKVHTWLWKNGNGNGHGKNPEDVERYLR